MIGDPHPASNVVEAFQRMNPEPSDVVGTSPGDSELLLPALQPGAVGPTYAHRFLDATARFAGKPALRWKEAEAWRDMSYSELEHRALTCAAALNDRGIVAGDRVAIWLENSWPWIVCDLACQLLGAVTTTIYHTLSPSQAIALLGDSEAKAILASHERLAALQEPHLSTTVELLVICADGGSIGLSFAELLRKGEQAIQSQPELATRLRAPAVQPEELSALFYTSGTTGEPKGVMLTHANLIANIENTIAQMMPDRAHIVLLHLPLAHVMARNTTVPATLLTGGVLAIAEPEREKIPSNLIEVAPTAFPTVPHLLDKFRERALEAINAKGFVMRRLALWALRHCRARRLAAIAEGGAVRTARLGLLGNVLDRIVLRKLRAKLGGRMKFLVTGGANSNRESMEFFWGIGIPVYEGYGATEVTNTAAITWSRAIKLGTVGQKVPGTELKLAPDGEILVRGPIVMKGYWRQPDSTTEAIDAEGWYHTGDIGTLDADGYVTIIDRKREILVLTTGKNIAPQAIENLLKRTPLVLNVCALGQRRRYTTALVVPNLEAIGQRLAMHVPPTTADPQIAELLREELSSLMSSLAHFEQVKRFTLIDEPFSPENGLVTPTLKLQRRKIAERYADEIEDLYADEPKRAIVV